MRRLVAVAVVSGLALVACATDSVLPDEGTPAVCGDGVVEAGEGCDVASPGCVDCQVAAGWTCTNGVCFEPCGDGITGDGASCSNPRRDTDCDLTGYWAVREKDYTCDNVFHQPQTSSNWYLYHLTQTGSDFVVDAELDCGVHVTGSVTVDYPPAALGAVVWLNAMDGTAGRPMRHGTSTATSGGCTVTLDRWYKIRGGEDSLLPSDFTQQPALSTLPPLPSVADPINGSDSAPSDAPGATDPDGDGFLGVSFQITGIVNGIQDSVQRDWKQYASDPATPVPAAALTVPIPGKYDLQNNVLHVSQCGTGCGLMTTGATATKSNVGTTLQFIGKTLTGSRVSSIVAGAPRADRNSDLTTCANVQKVLPHDGTAAAGVCAGN